MKFFHFQSALFHQPGHILAGERHRVVIIDMLLVPDEHLEEKAESVTLSSEDNTRLAKLAVEEVEVEEKEPDPEPEVSKGMAPEKKEAEKSETSEEPSPAESVEAEKPEGEPKSEESTL